jgi:hypothetical protein
LSAWKDLNELVITDEFGRGNLAAGARNYVQCSDGRVAAFQYTFTDNDGVPMLQIYESVDGADVPLAFVSAMAGADILRGLFTTGIIPTKDIFDDECRFLRVDY